MHNLYKQVLVDKVKHKYAKADHYKSKIEDQKDKLMKANFSKFKGEAQTLKKDDM